MIFILEEDGTIYVFGNADEVAGYYCDPDLLDDERYVAYASSGRRLRPELDPSGEPRLAAGGQIDREGLLGLLESGRPVRSGYEPGGRERRNEAQSNLAISVESVKSSLRRAIGQGDLPVIGRDDVMPLLVKACPSFAPRWLEIETDPGHLEADGNRLCYIDAGEFARHLIRLHQEETLDEIALAFDIIERLHVEGDEYVRQLATIGYLESLQNQVGWGTEADPPDFTPYLGPVSLYHWRRLDESYGNRKEPGRPVGLLETIFSFLTRWFD